jgi:SAM-dependent methyltransferase
LYDILVQHLAGKKGLELGGPSAIFGRTHLIPVYNVCHTVDLCNYSEQTIWSEVADKQTNKLGLHLGRRFVAEACDLAAVPSGTYDFVLASHVLEHIANPLRALTEWKRVLKADGTVLVVVPHKRGTFDHKRAFTSFNHILADFEAQVSEDDLSHLDEILSLHDLCLDPPAGSHTNFKERCLQNSTVRGMHHHVFSPEVLVSMFDHLQMRVLNITVERPFHIIGFAQKADRAEYEQVKAHNETFSAADAAWKRHDPFRNFREVQGRR